MTGPATVIRAIAAGKVAAATSTSIWVIITSFPAMWRSRRSITRISIPAAAVNMSEREAGERKCDFCEIERCMTKEEAAQEAARCLRCDHYGYGNLKGGRAAIW